LYNYSFLTIVRDDSASRISAQKKLIERNLYSKKL